MIAHTRGPEHDGGVAWEAAPALPEPDIHVDVDAARLWSESGCQAVTHPDAAVPARLVATVAGVVDRLDSYGAGVDERFGWRGLGALAERAATLLFRRSGRSSCGGGSRLLATADGWVAATLARPPIASCCRLGSASTPARHVSSATPSRGPRSRAVWRSASRQRWSSVRASSGWRARVSARSWHARRCCGCRWGMPRRVDLHGVRVVNLASLWAGPLAALVLARLGADVVCVESTGRPDGAWATPHWFDAMHTGQRSVASLDFRREEGVATLAALLAAADVVIEGSRPRCSSSSGSRRPSWSRRGPRCVGVDHRLRARSNGRDACRARGRRGGCRRSRRLGRWRSRVPRRRGRRPADRPRLRPRDPRRRHEWRSMASSTSRSPEWHPRWHRAMAIR